MTAHIVVNTSVWGWLSPPRQQIEASIMARSGTPSGMGKIMSRVGKKQVVAFLSPEQAEAARNKARLEGKTIQEILGEAINAVFASHGRTPPIAAGHGRIVRRVNSIARVRTLDTNPACRSGRISVGGWFLQEEVDYLTLFAAELGASNQAFVQYGMGLVTDVKPDGNEWKIAAGEALSPVKDGIRLRGRPKNVGIERRVTARDAEGNIIRSAVRRAKVRLLTDAASAAEAAEA